MAIEKTNGVSTNVQRVDETTAPAVPSSGRNVQNTSSSPARPSAPVTLGSRFSGDAGKALAGRAGLFAPRASSAGVSKYDPRAIAFLGDIARTDLAARDRGLDVTAVEKFVA